MLEDVLVRQGIDYQVIGGPRFYERAEIKDAIAYLQVIDNPFDAVSLQRIANRPRRGFGDTSLARLQAFADGAGITLWEALGRAEEAGLATASLKSAQSPVRACSSRCMAAAQELSLSELVETMLQRSGYLEALEPSARSRPAAGSRTSKSSSASRRSTNRGAEEPSLSSFLQEISLYSDQDALRDGEDPAAR